MMETWDGQISGRYFQIFSYDADYYRMLKEWASSEQYEREAATFLQLIKACAEEKILDIGCGTGRLMELIQRQFGSLVIGVDCGSGWHPPQQETIRYGRAEAIPFADSSFDVAILSHVLGHVEAVLPVLREAWRILKPGGRLGIVTPELACQQEWYAISQEQAREFDTVDPTLLRYISKDALKKDLANMGFRVTAEKEYGNVSPIGTTKELYAVIAQKIARDGEE
jgi:ubiquinone/menaquinone biosynthesis C-methylase UbiE